MRGLQRAVGLERDVGGPSQCRHPQELPKGGQDYSTHSLTSRLIHPSILLFYKPLLNVSYVSRIEIGDSDKNVLKNRL